MTEAAEAPKLNLYQKIVAVMNKVGKLQKDGEINNNKGAKMYSYLSEEKTTSTLQQAFIEFGLVLMPIKVEEQFDYITGVLYDKEFKNPVTKLLVTYKIVDAETGEHELLQSIGYGTDNADKGSNKAMTNAFKYVQRQTFMIASGEDSDHTSSEELTRQNSGPAKPKQQSGSYNAPKAQTSQNKPQNAPQTSESNAISPAQVGLCKKLVREKHVSNETVFEALSVYGKDRVDALTKWEASKFIEFLNNFQAEPSPEWGQDKDDLPF